MARRLDARCPSYFLSGPKDDHRTGGLEAVLHEQIHTDALFEHYHPPL